MNAAARRLNRYGERPSLDAVSQRRISGFCESGATTLYGHFSQITVAQGDRVEQGDVLGLGGATGNATGKHLHFEVHEDNQVVDPQRFLPAVQRRWIPWWR